MAMGPLVREGEGERRVTARDGRYGNGVIVWSHMEVKGEREGGNSGRTAVVVASENRGGDLGLTGAVHASEAKPKCGW